MKKIRKNYIPYLLAHLKKTKPLVSLLGGASRRIYSYENPDAEISVDKPNYPVLIFSPGGGDRYDSNSVHCQELASHGYVVVGISHTYDSMVVRFPDGRIADGLQSMIERGERSIKNKTSLEDDQNQGLAIWIADAQFVLDQLEQLVSDKESLFYQRLDQKNVGYFGHSVGGSLAIQICRRDMRIKAAVDLDGPLTGPEALQPFDKPLMFLLTGNFVKIFEGPWTEEDWKNFARSLAEATTVRSQYLPSFKQLAQSVGHDVYVFVVKDVGHNDFTDSVELKHASLWFTVLKKFGMAGGLDLEMGSIDGGRAVEIVNAYLVNFFDKYLKGQPSKLLEVDETMYAEVETKQWLNK